MSKTLEPTIVRLPDYLVTEIELLRGDRDMEDFVCQAVQAQIQAVHRHSLQEQLARDYDGLAALYDELAGELADETWLPLENEALLHTELHIGKDVTP